MRSAACEEYLISKDAAAQVAAMRKANYPRQARPRRAQRLEEAIEEEADEAEEAEEAARRLPY